MKKNSFKAMLYLICISTLMPSVVGQAKTIKKDKPGTAIFVMCQIPCVMATTKHINKDLPTLYLDIKIPRLHGFSDKKFEKKLNKRFLKEGMQKAKYATDNATTYNEQNLASNIPPLKFEYLSNYTLIETVEPYFVIEFLDYEYSGGAHGISTQSYVNIDISNNKELTLKDLFKPNVPYKEVINTEINRQIKERTAQGEFFFTGSDGFSGIKDAQNFYINKKGEPVIVFNVYEIAPYAAGAVEFAIPLERLKDLVK